MLEVLRRIVEEVNSSRGLQQALNTVVERVQETLAVNACALYLVDPDTQQYILHAARGYEDAAIGRVSINMDEGLVGLVGTRAEPLNIPDAHKHPNNQYFPEMGEDRYHAFIGAPIIHHRDMLGVLVVQDKQKKPFDQEVESFVITLATQLAVVLAHAEATGSVFELSQTGENRYLTFEGVSGAPGAAIGVACVLSQKVDLEMVPDKNVKNSRLEKRAFERAVAMVRKDIRRASKSLLKNIGVEEELIFDVYIKILEDNSVGGQIIELIDEGQWAQGAVSQVMQRHAKAFDAMDDPYLRERATDVRDLGSRILAYLQAKEVKRDEFPDNAILIGEELTPAILGEIPPEKLAGLVSIRGSSNSHIVILARAMEIPTVVGVDIPHQHMEGMDIILDGYQGRVFSSPTPELVQEFEQIIRDEQAVSKGLEHLADEPADTLDGHSIALRVNTSLMADVPRAMKRGAEGVGLYRTEVSFMMTDRFPSERQQYEFYREQLEGFAPHPVTMRTLDVGGDKALPYFPIHEENPFLGWRGVRITLDHPEIFLVQVRAMLKASHGLNNLRILLPMISDVEEIDESKQFIEQALQEVREEGLDVETPMIGAMIEVPAAVYQVKDIAKRVDFLSVGSNDLTQYLLAVDRNNTNVVDLYKAYHPAVMKALKLIVDAGRQRDISVSICGELAGDPKGALLLMAMGYDELSMNAANLLKVKNVIRHSVFSELQEILRKVMRYERPDQIESLLNNKLRAMGIEYI